MKRILLSAAVLVSFLTYGQNVGINTTGANPDGSAMLDVVSSDKGMLIPRVNLSATNLATPVTSPTTSLIVYNSASSGAGATAVTPGYYYWTGTEWVRLFNSGDPIDDWKLLGNAGTVAGTNYLGTSDAVDLVFKTNNAEHVRILSGGNVGVGTSAPSTPLEVQGASGDENTGIVRIGTAASNLRLGAVDGSRNWIQSHASLPLYVNSLGNNTILNSSDGANRNVGIGVTAPSAKLEVDFNSNDNFAAVKASGEFGPTYGYLGVQGKTDFDGVTTADWNGEEIGVAGISVGGSTTDNYGVMGHSNGAGVRAEHSTSGTWVDLATSTRSINANGDAYISNGWLSVGGNTGTIRKYATAELYWDGNVQADDNQPNYLYVTVGTFPIPTGIPAGTTIRIDEMFWSMDGFHADANEDKAVEVTPNGANYYGIFENSANGRTAINWQDVTDFGTGGPTFSSSTPPLVRFRVMDDNCCNDDRFNVYNMKIVIYYSYSVALQPGDISASGLIYSNSDQQVGDLAEYFPVKGGNAGTIVSLIPGSDNEYEPTPTSYNQHLVGVISDHPSVVLNSSEVGPPVALTGRVDVKVRADQPLIKSGDFLTSSEGGYAIKCEKPGASIGYAVENQKAGSNKVEILVQPGRYYVPDNLEMISQERNDFTIDEENSNQIENLQLGNEVNDDNSDSNDLDLPPGKYKTINGVPVELIESY